jgi:hypothetical protein
MTRDELVKKVTNAIEEMPHWDLDQERVARVAIDIVLEEAAKVAERMLVYADTTSEADKAIPAAIRALGKDER